ncbi:Ger(x)C family spore germination protein [Paenibacillus whitsoniae]|uniref:Ger(X)C family spore germination protein n=1 Tax=Paenibacillus whitsoniae TaxID=2496558 RepID=A0A3S0IB05_9BACL|nr:Ger(x)C family spore germination protein [Paenibacillus whitsoniae]RTE09033.1 Ger(x)C family spore germination protein [Paenibacillus whitsoniae]
MHRYRKLLLIALAGISVLLLTGCWSRIEINDNAFVTAMYVDRLDNDQYEVSLGFPLPNRMATGAMTTNTSTGNAYSIVSKRAESIAVAIRKIRSDLSREITWGHCRVVIVGRKMAEQGIGPMLEFASREPSFHSKSFLFVSPTKGQDISKLTPVFERLPSEVIREYAQRHVTLGATIKDFLQAEASGGDMVAGMLTIGKIEMVSEKGKLSTWVGTDGAAVFKAGVLVGELDVMQMRAGLWMQGNMKSSLNSLRSPTDHKMISFLIQSSKASIKPHVEGDRIWFTIDVEADDDIISSESQLNLLDPENINMLERMLSEQLNGRILRAIKATQALEADAFNFGRILEWHYPKVWEKNKNQWREMYKNCEFVVNSKIFVRRTGTEKNSMAAK